MFCISLLCFISYSPWKNFKLVILARLERGSLQDTVDNLRRQIDSLTRWKEKRSSRMSSSQLSKTELFNLSFIIHFRALQTWTTSHSNSFPSLDIKTECPIVYSSVKILKDNNKIGFYQWGCCMYTVQTRSSLTPCSSLAPRAPGGTLKPLSKSPAFALI